MKLKTRAFLRDSAFLFVIVGIDQGIKTIVRCAPVGEILLETPLLSICRTENSGAAFGLFASHPVLLSIISTIILMAFAICICPKQCNGYEQGIYWFARILLLGGGMGNLADRLLRGSVTDYILLRFINFPLFNFADICITVSGLFFIIILLREGISDGRKRNP